jgi:hypothetical protein
MLIFFIKMGIKELQVMFVSKPSKNHRVSWTRTLWLSGRVFDFLTQKMLRMVKSLAALCTVSSEQATLYNCGCVLKLFFFLSLKHKLLYEGDIDCL